MTKPAPIKEPMTIPAIAPPLRIDPPCCELFEDAEALVDSGLETTIVVGWPDTVTIETPG